MTLQRLYNGVRFPLNGPCIENVRRIDMGCLPMILEMQRTGILIDPNAFATLSRELGSDCDRLTENVRAETGCRINVGSPDQVAWLLFDKLKLKPPPNAKKVAKGTRYSVDDDLIQAMLADHPVVPMIDEYRECDKLKTSYADALPVIAGRDSRVRTSLRTTRVTSGRLSSSEPNLMAIPTRTDLGKRVRKCFIASKGKVLGTADLSQIEMRDAADTADCTTMKAIFRNNGDVHSETASRMFDLPVDKLDKMEHRYPAKRVGFGVLYGIQAEGLLAQMLAARAKGWTLERCAEMIELWYSIYPEMRAFAHRMYALARRFRMVWDRFGRIRWIPEVRSTHKRVVAEGLRAAGNHPIQSDAQAIIKLAMAWVQDVLLPAFGGVIAPLLQIHDELLFEGPPGPMSEFMPMVAEAMSTAVELSIPLKASWAIAETWGDLDK